jgi:hypothetical protein
MSIRFKPNKKLMANYDKRADLMIQGIIERRADLASNSADLRDYDVELAKQGEP